MRNQGLGLENGQKVTEVDGSCLGRPQRKGGGGWRGGAQVSSLSPHSPYSPGLTALVQSLPQTLTTAFLGSRYCP